MQQINMQLELFANSIFHLNNCYTVHISVFFGYMRKEEMPVCGQNRYLGGGSSVTSTKESRVELLQNRKSQKINRGWKQFQDNLLDIH